MMSLSPLPPSFYSSDARVRLEAATKEVEQVRETLAAESSTALADVSTKHAAASAKVVGGGGGCP